MKFTFRELHDFRDPTLLDKSIILESPEGAKKIGLQSVDMLFIKAVERSLEAFLWNYYRKFGCRYGDEGDAFDVLHTTFQTIKNSASIALAPRACKGNAPLTLMYCGSVSTMRSAGHSFQLLEMFGVPFYLNSDRNTNVGG